MNQNLMNKLMELEMEGEIVPDPSLLKTPEQIEAIKKSAALNTAILDHVAKHICAGMSTAEMPAEMKNQVSHRANALNVFYKKLKEAGYADK